MPFDQELAASAEKTRDKVAVLAGKPKDQVPIIHVCIGCRAMHYRDGDGYRLFTPAEEFQMRVEHADTIDLLNVLPLGATIVGMPR